MAAGEDRPVAVGLDVGGTKLAAALIAGDGARTERAEIPSPVGSSAELLAAVEEVVGRLDPDGRLPVGIGFAGIVTRDGTVRYGPNVDVTDLPLAAELAGDRDAPVVVLNDASAAMAGELHAGAARGVDDAVLLTLGTGVGGGLAVDGRLVHGAGGFAGELGHLLVEDGGRACPCGNHGCLEAYASGHAIAAVAAERLRAGGPGAADSPLEADTVTGRDVAAAAGDGDALALGVLEWAGGWLGVALASLVNALDPALVVVGGGVVAGAGAELLPVARKVVADRVVGAAHRTIPPVVPAELGNDAGLVGAGLLAAGRP